MGVGAAISVAGGVMQMAAGHKAAKMGQEASAFQEQYMKMAQQSLEQSYGQAEGALAGNKVYLEQAMDMSKAFQDLMGNLSSEYGDYANEMWKDFEDTFGSLRGNLVEYYQNLDPMKYSTQMKSAIGQEINKATEQFDQIAAQSGIYTSGMRQQMQKEAAFNKAEQFAKADIMAPELVAQQQGQFYGQFGEPQRQQAMSLQGNAILNQGQMAQLGMQPVMNTLNAQMGQNQNMASLYQNKGQAMSNLYSGMSNQYGKSAAGYGQAAGLNSGRGLNNIMSGVGKMFPSSGIDFSLF